MEMRTLGRSGLKVSTICFGTMTFGGKGFFKSVGSTGVKEAKSQLKLCYDAGINFFDTADIYSFGQSEEILGEALGSDRKNVLVATKVFAPMGEGPNDMGLSRHHIISACEASLKRLKTDYIDLYQVHNADSITPVEETMRALDDLVRDGKVRYIGSSNWSAWQSMKSASVSEKYGLERFVSQQIQYSLIHREAELEMLPVGVDQGIGAILWSPLAQGYLTGKFRNSGTSEGTRLGDSQRLDPMDDERGRKILDVLEDVVSGYPNATMTQGAINYLMRKGGVSSVIIGARTDEQLKDSLGAASWAMSDEDVRRLDEASAKDIPYPQSHQRFNGRGRNPELPLLPIAVPE